MRLLLDAHISARASAAALRKAGHDVLAVAEHTELDHAEDAFLLQLASEQGRILVTFDAKDFPRILREVAEVGGEHTGCIIVVGIDHSEFGLVLTRLDAVFSRFPDQEAWRNLPRFLGRGD